MSLKECAYYVAYKRTVNHIALGGGEAQRRVQPAPPGAALGRAPRFSGQIADVPPSVQALLFDREEGGRVLAFWSTSGETVSFSYLGETYEAAPAVRFAKLPAGH